MKKVIISPVGTSMLTNNVEAQSIRNLYQYSNTQESEMPVEIKELLDAACQEIEGRFSNNIVSDLRKMSAELNGIFGVYENNITQSKQDVHFLISTDTFQGKMAAGLLSGFLSNVSNLAQVITPRKLSTKSKEDFRGGVRELLKWCEDTLPGYKESGYEIIFNLTGGFKSLQGYLNTIGMFYADRIVYIFESANELITIPRLPININNNHFKENASLFLQLDQTNEGVDRNRLIGIWGTMIEEFQNDKYVLSDWGELSWNKVSGEILSKELIPLPFIAYEDSFVREFMNTKEAKKKVILQKLIGKISCFLQESNGDISVLKGGKSGGLLYDNYSGTNNHLGHFRINRGDRVSCEYRNQTLFLRHFGEHDYVNDNP